MSCSCAALQYTMKSLALILGLLVAVQALPAKGPTPLDVYMPVIKGAPMPIPPKVEGGQAAVLGQFPYQAAILIGSSSFCGGSLIAGDWILTAAHCAPIATFQVILGRIRWQGTGGVSVASRYSIVHGNYDPQTLANDIALLQLPVLLIYTNNVQPVALPTPADASNTFAGVTATVSGWGVATPTGGVSSNLMWVELSVITNDQCAQIYGPNIITSSRICASGAGGRGACAGDSGGPLVIQRFGGGFTQIGVVSFVSEFGCDFGDPSGYTRVTSFRDWIQLNTGV